MQHIKTFESFTASQHETLYHLTDKVDFKLDPNYEPENNTTWGGSWEPGIFLSERVTYWTQAHGYWRPWVVEFEVPTNIRELSGVMSKGYGGEVYIPAEHFDLLKVIRVMPLDAWYRENYGLPGEIEGWAKKAFDGKPLPVVRGNEQPFDGYHFDGDARDWTPAQQKKYEKQVADYLEWWLDPKNH